MDNLKELIEILGIKMGVVSAPFNPYMEDSKQMFHWACTFSREDKPLEVFNVVFSTGAGLLQVKAKRSIPPFSLGVVTIKDIQKIKDGVRAFYYDFERKVYRKYGTTSIFEAELAKALLEPAPPTAEDVLDCLLSDASAMDYDAFEDWASDYGYDTDSIKARDTFHNIRKQSKRLMDFLGREAFREGIKMERL